MNEDLNDVTREELIRRLSRAELLLDQYRWAFVNEVGQDVDLWTYHPSNSPHGMRHPPRRDFYVSEHDGHWHLTPEATTGERVTR